MANKAAGESGEMMDVTFSTSMRGICKFLSHNDLGATCDRARQGVYTLREGNDADNSRECRYVIATEWVAK
jgi:hypothetical protein